MCGNALNIDDDNIFFLNTNHFRRDEAESHNNYHSRQRYMDTLESHHMSKMSSQITDNLINCLTACLGQWQRKYQRSTLLVLCEENPTVTSGPTHKEEPVMRKFSWSHHEQHWSFCYFQWQSILTAYTSEVLHRFENRIFQVHVLC